MSYSINPNLPKARALAMKLLLMEDLSVQVVANKCGVNRTTIYRWKIKWDKLNENVQFDNPNRPNRIYSQANHLLRCTWHIPTQSSRPLTSPRAISEEIVKLVLVLRTKLKRCAEIIWWHITNDYEINISLSSVRRILKRTGYANGRKKRVRPDNPKRPHVKRPGELVQTDTIHHVDPKTGRRLYYYTVIDLYTRMVYVSLSTKLRQGLAASAVLGAQKKWGFVISMAQSDNGPEYGHYFEQVLRSKGITTRHTRLHRPNDNAHIERFNRTIQTECIGYYWDKSISLQNINHKLTIYLDYYNNRRVHLKLQFRTPQQMLQSS